MNLSTPPPVEPLDPEYAEQLRAELVRAAKRSRRPRHRWVPVLAAACAIAAVFAGLVVLDRPDRGPAKPPATTPSVPSVPASQSARESLDLGPATDAEARASGRQCVAYPHSIGRPDVPAPDEIASAKLEGARWLKALPGRQTMLEPLASRVLVATFTTSDGRWVTCLENQLVNAQRGRPAGVSQLVSGQWTAWDVPIDSRTLFYLSLEFDAAPVVAEVQLRIRWAGGASSWYAVPSVGGAGYVQAIAPEASHAFGDIEADLRALDRSGRQVYERTVTEAELLGEQQPR